MWQYVIRKLNPDDTELHANFDYTNLRNSHCVFGTQYPSQNIYGLVHILQFTEIEKLLSSTSNNEEEFRATHAALMDADKRIRLKT